MIKAKYRIRSFLTNSDWPRFFAMLPILLACLLVLGMIISLLIIHAYWLLTINAYTCAVYPPGNPKCDIPNAFALIAIGASIGLFGAAALKRKRTTVLFAAVLLLGWMGVENFSIRAVLPYLVILTVFSICAGLYWAYTDK